MHSDQEKSVSELKKAFQDSINDYLEWCEERNEQPEKTYSGKLHFRIKPDLNAHFAAEAIKQGISLNNFINQKLYT